jgi:hypothetical protein
MHCCNAKKEVITNYREMRGRKPVIVGIYKKQKQKKTPWPQSASEQYRPNDCRLSTKLVLNSADREGRVVSVTDPYGSILGFLDRSRYLFFQVAPQLYSRG